MSGAAVKRKHNKKPERDNVERINGAPKVQKKSPSMLPRGLLATLMVVAAISSAVYIYYNHLLFDSTAEVLDDVAFEVVDLPGRGKGMIATRDIQQGELILRETPLILMPKEVVTHSPGATLLASLASLTPKQRETYYNLAHIDLPMEVLPGSEAYNDLLALYIFQTNAVSAGDSAGLFPRMARLNHACSSAFNSIYTWRENEHALVVYALKPIKRGQELLTTYLDSKRPRDERRSYLHQHYGFECQCEVCSLPAAESIESDKRLSKMAHLYWRFASWGPGELSGREAVDVAREIWLTGEEEGYWSERGQLAADVALVAAAHADYDGVRAWAELSSRWYSYEVGSDSEQVQWITKVHANPRSHQMWATRQKEAVGLPGPLLT